MAEHKRVGHCLGCGQHCCAHVVVPLTPAMADAVLAHQPVWLEPSGNPDYEAWLGLHGLPVNQVQLLPTDTSYSVISDGTTRVPVAWIHRACRALQADGSCALYDQPDRPQMCGDWPYEPLNLLTMSRAGQRACGYHFTT
jgi:hypothetical protein